LNLQKIKIWFGWAKKANKKMSAGMDEGGKEKGGQQMVKTV